MNLVSSFGESKMVDSSGMRRTPSGELFRPLRPHGGKIVRSMVVQVIDITYDQATIDANEPSVQEASRSGSGDNQPQVGEYVRLGGEFEWPCFWCGRG